MIKKYLLAAVAIIILLTMTVIAYRTIQHQNWLEERRIELLEDALAPKTAESAAYSWAEAIKTRNGAWQYAIMSEELRQQYLEQFEESNWVTGFSSPWVEKYQVTRESEDEQGNVMFKVKFDWYTSGGYEYSNTGTLTVSKFNNSQGKWLIIYLDFDYGPDE